MGLTAGKAVTDRFTSVGQNAALSQAAKSGPNMSNRAPAAQQASEALRSNLAGRPSAPSGGATAVISARATHGSMAGYMGGRTSTILVNGTGYDNPVHHRVKPSVSTPSSRNITLSPLTRSYRGSVADMRSIGSRIPESHRKVR